MEEIKFRARNAGLPRCWIYGYFVIENDHCFIINDSGKFKVIAGTQEQCIGLRDMRDREIYDGNILRDCKTDDKSLDMQIIFKHGCFGYISSGRDFVPLGRNHHYFKLTDGSERSHRLLIIGDINE